MKITPEYDQTSGRYFQAIARESGRLIIAEGATHLDAMRACAAIIFERRIARQSTNAMKGAH